MSKIDYSAAIKQAGSNDGLCKVQDAAIKAATSARVKIQVALIATLIHLAKNHDVAMARRIVDGLHDTVRGNALVKWLTKYGHLVIGEMEVANGEDKTKTVTTFVGIDGKADSHAQSIRESLDEAKATMWWETVKASNPYSFDLNDALQGVIRQHVTAMKRIKSGKADAANVKTEVNDSTVQAVLALCNFDAIIPANDEAAKLAAVG